MAGDDDQNYLWVFKALTPNCFYETRRRKRWTKRYLVEFQELYIEKAITILNQLTSRIEKKNGVPRDAEGHGVS
jgi:hypothetical protein